MKASAEPAKSKDSLAACGTEKLRATVQATRLKCKELSEHFKHLQTKIEKDGVEISASFETDLLKIMGGGVRSEFRVYTSHEILLGTTNGTTSNK